jgi:hypothetical protein
LGHLNDGQYRNKSGITEQIGNCERKKEKKRKITEIACQFWTADCMTEDPAITCTIPYS